MGFLQTPEDYMSMGIDPPTVDMNGTAEVASAKDNHRHLWHQIGPEVYCEAGPHRHGFFTDTKNILTGTDEEGKPVYKVIEL